MFSFHKRRCSWCLMHYRVTESFPSPDWRLAAAVAHRARTVPWPLAVAEGGRDEQESGSLRARHCPSGLLADASWPGQGPASARSGVLHLFAGPELGALLCRVHTRPAGAACVVGPITPLKPSKYIYSH